MINLILYVKSTCAVFAMILVLLIDFSFASENRLKAHENLGHDENGKALDYGRGGRGNAIKGPKPYQGSSINQNLYNSKDKIQH